MFMFLLFQACLFLLTSLVLQHDTPHDSSTHIQLHDSYLSPARLSNTVHEFLDEPFPLVSTDAGSSHSATSAPRMPADHGLALVVA